MYECGTNNPKLSHSVNDEKKRNESTNNIMLSWPPSFCYLLNNLRTNEKLIKKK